MLVVVRRLLYIGFVCVCVCLSCRVCHVVRVVCCAFAHCIATVVLHLVCVFYYVVCVCGVCVVGVCRRWSLWSVRVMLYVRACCLDAYVCVCRMFIT